MDSYEILTRFEKQADGRWVCREPVTVETADGPVSVRPGMAFTCGNTVGDVDLAELLERLGAQHGS
ncbi:hypothetical protein [Enterovirga sp. CN4-39]|uniref:hypothetical protein n=1 Tax=Enterovirga sp. CN4-39 TaxID=3400910 RepID=UPI003C076A47